MDETVLDALTAASLFEETEASALAQDLGKIHSMTEEASRSPLAKEKRGEEPSSEILICLTPDAGERGQISLREDEACSRKEKDGMSQFGRTEESYVVLPRVL